MTAQPQTRLFTEAARRALAEAAYWSRCSDSMGLEPPEVLIGLLSENECRAAAMLTRHGIDSDTVRRRWPDLTRATDRGVQRVDAFAPATIEAFVAVEQRLWDYPRPVVLATEHLLLGLAAAQDEVAEWLASQGLSAQAIEIEVHAIYGHRPDDSGESPLSIPDDQVSVEPPPSVAQSKTIAPPAFSQDPKARSGRGGAEDHRVVLRIVDAAGNRAREALRVVEDISRFGLNDCRLTRELKLLRHALARALAHFDRRRLLELRDTPGDIGTDVAAPDEYRRAGVRELAAANFARLTESLRSLEECAKLESPQTAQEIEQLRYRAYALEPALAGALVRAGRMEQARLYALVDGRASPDEFCRLVETLVAAGVHVLQLRDKRLSDRELLDRGRALQRLTHGTQTLFVMNDRPDLALLAAADGVHVGQDESTVDQARSIVGLQTLVGVSTHSLAQAQQAADDGADYIGVGPVFPSATKRFESLVGVELLREVAAVKQLPAFAIGGVTWENVDQVLAAGFRRVAVGHAIVNASDPAAAVARFLDKLR